ncbi:MAG: D-alanyl-D-alanine carboxypeptidase/D-alanyl-D-alanine-endopeptidase [Rhodobacteraceae bacterium PARR1]|nr:MAG: D-alanyl-D-alanine carboxypeptidase/D-alanyl-D-alanine-endopeptidase [Rhodobacteraceae bacterium PARR1]
MMISRRGVLGGLLAGVASPVWAETRPKPRPGSAAARQTAAGPDAAALVAAANLGGKTGLVVADARSGQVLEAVEPDAALPPASTAKTITTLYALERLGPAHRFVTQVLATGPVAGGIVQGDLVLAGSGDPLLDTDDLGDLAAALKGAGVRGCTGRYLVWDGALPEIDEISTDQPDYVGYNPAISGLNLNFNRVYFEWKRQKGGWGTSVDARGERFVPPVSMARVSVADRETPLFTYRNGQEAEEWTVAAAALGKGGSRWLPVRHPGRYTAEVFHVLARAQGIDLPAPALVGQRPSGQVLAQFGSDALPDILRGMLRHSTNLTAEVMGLSSSGAGRLAASGATMTDWAADRLGARGKFVDHSGLGASSRISALEFARALVAAQATPMAQTFKAVLRDLGTAEEGEEGLGGATRVIGKTGTLNFASSLVGYIQPASGRELVFAILSADTKRRDGLSMAERESPPGGKAWLRRARGLQRDLLARWAGLYA